MADAHSVFQSNPAAILGGSWGNSTQSNNSYGNTPSANSQPSSQPSYQTSDLDSFSDEDDDYAPIQMGTWGTQQGKDETPQFNVPVGGWSSLIDPNFKIKPGGLGSGNLHRRGGNYKPVDEQHILNQRLKNQPVPKSAAKKAKSKSQTPTPRPSTPKGKPACKKSYEPQRQHANHPPPPSTIRVPRNPAGPSGWGSAPLVDKPFWEGAVAGEGARQSKYASPQPAAPAATPSYQQASGASHTQPAQPAYATPSHGGASESKWASAPAPSHPPQQPQLQSQSQWAQVPTPSSGYSSAASRSPSTSTGFVAGSSTSKYASREAKDAVPLRVYEQQKQPEIIFSFNIELAPGIYAPLPVYRGVDYLDLVNRFEESHNLRIENEAKQAFASKIAVLVDHQMKLRGMPPQN